MSFDYLVLRPLPFLLPVFDAPEDFELGGPSHPALLFRPLTYGEMSAMDAAGAKVVRAKQALKSAAKGSPEEAEAEAELAAASASNGEVLAKIAASAWMGAGGDFSLAATPAAPKLQGYKPQKHSLDERIGALLDALLSVDGARFFVWLGEVNRVKEKEGNSLAK